MSPDGVNGAIRGVGGKSDVEEVVLVAEFAEGEVDVKVLVGIVEGAHLGFSLRFLIILCALVVAQNSVA